MLKSTLIALRVTIVTLILAGLVYPLAVTALAQLLFPGPANGSLVKDAKGQVVGSALIGQNFSNPAYFHSRPSAAGGGYDATASSGSNLGPTSAKLRDRMTTDTLRLQAENPDASGPVPVDLVTASASGLDPDITPEAALWQVPRVAKARNISDEALRRLVLDHVRGRTFGLLGEPRVNVLELNLALDEND